MHNFQTLGLRILACVRSLKMLDSLWFNAYIYVFGYGIRDPQFETSRIAIHARMRYNQLNAYGISTI